MATRRVRRPGEFELIERYFRPLAGERGAFGLTDDAALYRQRPNDDLVLTSDMVAEGVHFFPDDPPDSVARKALRVNLSDLAAKGAVPFGYLLSLALPGDWTEAWIRKFVVGLTTDQARYEVALLGGDTIRAPDGITISIAAIGRVPKGRMIMRSGARPGDAIFVSGTIGDAALGLKLRQNRLATPKGAKYLLDRYLHPQPRLPLVPVLRRHATSAMDVSDGLVGDLAHICEVSGVGAEIESLRVPLSTAARRSLVDDYSLLSTVLNGGDDYEILATVAASAAGGFTRAARAVGVPVTRIGRIVAGKGPPVVKDATGQPIRIGAASHTHF